MNLKDTIEVMEDQIDCKESLDPDEKCLDDRKLLGWLKELDELREKQIDVMRMEKTIEEDGVLQRAMFVFLMVMVIANLALSVCLHRTRKSFDELEQLVYEYNIDDVDGNR